MALLTTMIFGSDAAPGLLQLPTDPMAVEEALIPISQVPAGVRGALPDRDRYKFAEDTLRARGVIRGGHEHFPFEQPGIVGSCGRRAGGPGIRAQVMVVATRRNECGLISIHLHEFKSQEPAIKID